MSLLKFSSIRTKKETSEVSFRRSCDFLWGDFLSLLKDEDWVSSFLGPGDFCLGDLLKELLRSRVLLGLGDLDRERALCSSFLLRWVDFK